jgi:hypothetical protein
MKNKSDLLADSRLKFGYASIVDSRSMCVGVSTVLIFFSIFIPRTDGFRTFLVGVWAWD